MDSTFALTLANTEEPRRTRVKVTRRVARLRTYLKIQQKRYTHRPITEISDPKLWLIALLTVERDFLYSQELGPSKQATSRLKRAHEGALELVKLSAGFEEIDRLEVIVYESVIGGYLALATKKYPQAIQKFSGARVGLLFLDEYGKEQNKGGYKAYVTDLDGVLSGVLHRSGIAATDLDAVSKKYVEGEVVNIVKRDPSYLTTEVSNVAKEVQWRSYTAKIKDQTLGKIVAKIETEKDYDALSSLISQGLEVHASYLVHETKEEDDEILSSYLQYSLSLTSFNRNVSLLESVKGIGKLQLLDKIDQEITTLSEIPGVFNDDELVEALETVKKYYEALKLTVVAEYTFDDHLKTLTVSFRASELLSGLKECEFLTQQEIDTLKKRVETIKTTSHVLTQIPTQNGDVVSDINTTGTLFDSGLKQIGMKPVLFDVVYNYVSHVADSVETAPAKSTTTTTKTTKTTTPAAIPSTSKTTSSESEKKKFFGLF